MPRGKAAPTPTSSRRSSIEAFFRQGNHSNGDNPTTEPHQQRSRSPRRWKSQTLCQPHGDSESEITHLGEIFQHGTKYVGVVMPDTQLDRFFDGGKTHDIRSTRSTSLSPGQTVFFLRPAEKRGICKVCIIAGQATFVGYERGLAGTFDTMQNYHKMARNELTKIDDAFWYYKFTDVVRWSTGDREAGVSVSRATAVVQFTNDQLRIFSEFEEQIAKMRSANAGVASTAADDLANQPTEDTKASTWYSSTYTTGMAEPPEQGSCLSSNSRYIDDESSASAASCASYHTVDSKSTEAPDALDMKDTDIEMRTGVITTADPTHCADSPELTANVDVTVAVTIAKQQTGTAQCPSDLSVFVSTYRNHRGKRRSRRQEDRCNVSQVNRVWLASWRVLGIRVKGWEGVEANGGRQQ